MKVLIDESIQQGVADLLVHEGHDALHVVAIGLGGGSDDQVLATAKRDGRILVTADTDFGDLLALSGESQPSVVLLRRPGLRPEERAEAIRAAFEAVGDRLESGALVVLEPHRIRIRDLPISRGAE